DEAALLQQADPFAHRRAVHAELFHQLSLGPDRLARPNAPRQNLPLDRVGDQLVGGYRIDSIELFACVRHAAILASSRFSPTPIRAEKIGLDWIIGLSDNHTIGLTDVNPPARPRPRLEIREEPRMSRIRHTFCLAALLTSSAAGAQQITDGVMRIGVMNDMSGLYADISGPGAIVAARMAVEDFGAAEKGLKVEVIGADHQNKPDLGSSIARKWLDTDQVDVIVDVPTSSVALAVNEIVRERNKVFLISGAASSDLTGAKCSPNSVHWTYDTWAL